MIIAFIPIIASSAPLERLVHTIEKIQGLDIKDFQYKLYTPKSCRAKRPSSHHLLECPYRDQQHIKDWVDWAMVKHIFAHLAVTFQNYLRVRL